MDWKSLHVDARGIKRNRDLYPQLADLLTPIDDELNPEAFFELSKVLTAILKYERQRNKDSTEHNNKQVRR